MAADEDVSVPFTLIRDASVDASVVGRFLFFMTKDVPPTGVKLLEASQSTFVAMVGPYFDPRENGDVVTVFEGRRVDGKISGKFNTRLVRGYRQVRAGKFVAVARAEHTDDPRTSDTKLDRASKSAALRDTWGSLRGSGGYGRLRWPYPLLFLDSPLYPTESWQTLAKRPTSSSSAAVPAVMSPRSAPRNSA